MILLGTPEDNPLIAFLKQHKFLPYTPKKNEYPGDGRGLIAWQRDGIGVGQESITLIGYDADGMGEAAGTFFEMFAGLEPLTPMKFPTTASIAPANKSAVKVDEGKIVQSMVLPDRVAAIKDQTFITGDGSIFSTLNREEIGEAHSLVKALSKSSVELKLAVFPPGRIVVGSDNRLLVITRKGAVKYDREVSADPRTSVITLVTQGPTRDQVVIGTSDGALAIVDLLKANDPPMVLLPGIDPKDKKTPRNPYLAGAVLGKDGLILVLTRNEAHIVSIPEKKIVQKIGGVNGDFGIQKLQNDLLISDGRTAQLISHEDGKVLARTTLPPDTVVVAGLSTGSTEKPTKGLIVGSELEGMVRRIDFGSDKEKEKVIWQHKTPRKIVKRITVGETGLVAVAYWGGLVNVFDPAGTLKMSRTFHQDVVDLKWDKHRLLVAPAEARLFVVELK